MLVLFQPVLFVCGMLAISMAAFMLIPIMVSLATNDHELIAFLIAAAWSAGIGLVLLLTNRPREFNLNARQLYLLTSLTWLMLSFFSALPLTLTDHPLTLTDAVFEAVSGITTTGSTVMSNLDQAPPSLLLWRSLLQWIGGIGVIGMAVSILPFLRVGGMRLFQTESSDWSEKSMPRFQNLARALVQVYIGMTLLCTLAYWFAGMTPFDAINHALTTVSTGGYATSDASMGRFNDTILWIAVLFMLLGSMPFTLFIRLITRPDWRILRDQQIRAFLLIVMTLTGALFLQQWLTTDRQPFEILTQAAFNIVSVISTTGFASADYTLWGSFSMALFFFVTFIGGCSGSTSGGMKIFRFQLSWLFLRDQMRRLVHPRGCFVVRYNGKTVTDDIMGSAVAFSFLFFLVLMITTLALALTGVDVLTSLTGAATALTNVGPGLGDIIGPAGNFASLPDSAKWILSLAMILGRLELLTLMVLLSPVFWRG